MTGPAFSFAPIAPHKRFIREGETRMLLVVDSPSEDQLADVVIVPSFGKTVHDLLLVSFYLRINGFRVTRFDARDHVGLSSGDIANFTLSQLERDLQLVLGARPKKNDRPLILVGLSLSAPVAWRVASQCSDLAGVVTLVGVVDVPETVERASGVALAPYRDPSASPPEMCEILGHAVRARPFVRDLDAQRYGGLEDTLNDIRRVDRPLHMIAAGRDPWVAFEKVERAHRQARAGSELVVLAKATHEVGRSISAAQRAVVTIVELCRKLVGQSGPVRVPPFTEFIETSSIESALAPEPNGVSG